MGKHALNRGYTLTESLVVLFVIVMLAMMLPFVSFRVTHIEDTESSILNCQLNAMSKQQTCWYDEVISFNENGNINQGRTRIIGGKECIFQLGFGRFGCE